MALQTSGPISLANIQTEFGGSNPISLSEYYGAAAGIPASGAIGLSNFYGATASKVQNLTIPAAWTGYSFRGDAKNAGPEWWVYMSQYPSYASQTYPPGDFKYPLQSFESSFAQAYGFNSIVVSIKPSGYIQLFTLTTISIWGSYSAPNTQNPTLDAPLTNIHLKGVKVTKGGQTGIFNEYYGGPSTFEGENFWCADLDAIFDSNQPTGRAVEVQDTTDWQPPAWISGALDQYVEIEWV